MMKNIIVATLLAAMMIGGIAGAKGTHSGQPYYNTVDEVQLLYTYTPSEGYWMLYARAVPSSGAANTKLTIRNSAGNVVHEEAIYPVSPLNPEYISHSISAGNHLTLYVQSTSTVYSTAGYAYYTY